MIVDLTLTRIDRKVREQERWIEFCHRPCPDLHFIPNLVEILAAVSDIKEQLLPFLIADFEVKSGN